MALQKVGYDGAWMFEVANTSTPKAVLEKAERRTAPIRIDCSTSASRTAQARRHASHSIAHAQMTHVYIEQDRRARRPDRHHQGLAAQPAVERQDPLSRRPRRHRVSAGRHGQERRARGDVQGRRSPLAGKRRHRHRHGARGQARERRLRADRERRSRWCRRRVDYPITPKEHGVDYLLDRRHLWIRAERQTAILRVRHEIIDAVRDFFNSQGFILADTPIFTPAACEGTTTLFPVQYFEDETAYLTQSGQLYNEANAMALGKVYAFGPTFRAEKSKTRRHLTEFWMVEPEMAYADLDDVITLAEGLITSVVGARARQTPPAS